MVTLSMEKFIMNLDARLFVFLTSFVHMVHPLQQTSLEETELAQQWSRITRAKNEVLDPQNDFYFLEERHISEHDLNDSFVMLFDLATFANEIFAAAPTLKRCQTGLKGFVKIFSPERSNMDDISRTPLRTLFLQLTAVVLALHAKQYAKSTSMQIPAEDVQGFCSKEAIPEVSLLSKSERTLVIDLAIRVANDKTQLLSLFGNTLILIRNQISVRLKSLYPEHSESAVKSRLKERERALAKLNLTLDIQKDPYENEVWLRLTQNVPSPSAPNDSHSDTNDENDMPSTPQREDSNNDMSIDERRESSTSTSDRPQQQRYPILTRAQRLARRRNRDTVDDEDAYVTELEDGVEEIPNKRVKAEGESRVSRRRGPTSTLAVAARDDVDQSQPVPPVPPAPPAPKVRRATRHWTFEEEERLDELVPMFLHDGVTDGARPRLVRWSKLKAYDESHGNVLRRRTQVMLKDKYRERTDDGRHREFVKNLNKARKAAVDAQQQRPNPL
ncbi:hypothetical protein BGZ99_008819 [Dissophora globulifera]|uniref:Uncharacterized protein n=1 Tax=Dissophora globulifera TaxID=979702 RepID=A0A9P6RR35_9FUNG|nr:hypothetical protein BGZ99_008819 [Dissophora globulifera]